MEYRHCIIHAKYVRFFGLSLENYDSTLIGWSEQTVQPFVMLGAAGLEFCEGKEARDSLEVRGWTISGDTLVCECDNYDNICSPYNFGIINPGFNSGDIINNNSCATIDVGEPRSSDLYNSIWYKFTTSSLGLENITISVAEGMGANNTAIALYAGSSCIYDSLVEVSYNRWCAISSGNLFAECLLPDTDYYIQLGTGYHFSLCTNLINGVPSAGDYTLSLAASSDPISCLVDSNYFITTWRTTMPNESITIPTYPGLPYNYTVDWGDGTVTAGYVGNAMHEYTVADTYSVSISGTFPRIYFNNGLEGISPEKIISIEQWGDIQWKSMGHAFYGCSNLTYNALSDAPKLDSVSDMSFMFAGASKFDGDLSEWKVDSVKVMYSLFRNATVFNGDIDDWIVSNVTDMRFMFKGASSFNRDIGGWNVSNVVDMSNMFNRASVFNQNLNSWTVSKVTNMNNMFISASAFNGVIKDWDVSSVANMKAMFDNASVFNDSIGGWEVDNVTDMSLMFDQAFAFNQDLSSWDVGKVTNMREMFSNATSFNKSLGTWDISQVTAMHKMLENHRSFYRKLR
ncbi:MAG: BspA family leucine-rich repeat surface protein [Chitinophagales bacterium]